MICSDRERIEANCVHEPNSGCWLWTACVSDNGYGKTTHRGRQQYAHRASYMEHVGEIPDGLVLDHLCRTRCCVNPAHLEAVTQRVNLLRGETTSSRHAAKTHCPQGHSYQEHGYVSGATTSRRCRACSKAKPHRRKTTS